MALPRFVIISLGMKAGCDVTTPAGATLLANDIAATTGEVLAANTIKRLVGVLPYEGMPRITTLNILARYLGWRDWKEFEGLVDRRDDYTSLFSKAFKFYDVCELPSEAKICFKWEPGRRIVLRHIVGTRCEVVEAENSKLRVGDTLEVLQVGDRFPLFVKNVIRDGLNLGSYAAAFDDGIYDLKLELNQ